MSRGHPDEQFLYFAEKPREMGEKRSCVCAGVGDGGMAPHPHSLRSARKLQEERGRLWGVVALARVVSSPHQGIFGHRCCCCYFVKQGIIQSSLISNSLAQMVLLS